MGTLVDLGGDDILCNTIYQGSTTQGGSTTSTGVTLIPIYKTITDSQLTAASAVSHTIYVRATAASTYKIAGVTAVFGTASTSGTLQVEVATGTQAVGAGTNQLTGTISLSGTANTPVNGTIIASPNSIGAGDRINLIFAGTVTNLVNGSVTVILQRTA